MQSYRHACLQSSSRAGRPPARRAGRCQRRPAQPCCGRSWSSSSLLPAPGRTARAGRPRVSRQRCCHPARLHADQAAQHAWQAPGLQPQLCINMQWGSLMSSGTSRQPRRTSSVKAGLTLPREHMRRRQGLHASAAAQRPCAAEGPLWPASGRAGRARTLMVEMVASPVFTIASTTPASDWAVTLLRARRPVTGAQAACQAMGAGTRLHVQSTPTSESASQPSKSNMACHITRANTGAGTCGARKVARKVASPGCSRKELFIR